MFDFRFNSGGSTGICAFPGMTALQKQFFWLCTPLLVLVPLCICYFYYAILDACSHRCECFKSAEDSAKAEAKHQANTRALLGPYDSTASSNYGGGGGGGGGGSQFSTMTIATTTTTTTSTGAIPTSSATHMDMKHSADNANTTATIGSLPPVGSIGQHMPTSNAAVARSLRMSPLTAPLNEPSSVGRFTLVNTDGSTGSGGSKGTTTGRVYNSAARRGGEDSSSGETTMEAAARRALTSVSSTTSTNLTSSSGGGSGSGGGTVTAVGVYRIPRPKRLKTRGPHFAAALTNICIYTYSSVLKAVFVLMHCVPIDGLDGTYLFEAAGTECYQGWQWALLPFLVALAALPLGILVWAMWKPHNVVPANAAKRAMMDVLFSPYAAHALPWNAVLLLQRFVLITFDTFLVVANTRVQVLTTVCVAFLVLHVSVQPFHRNSMNLFQLLCLSLLVLIGLTNSPAASLLTSGYPSNDVTTRAFSILSSLQSAMLAIPFSVAFVIWTRTKIRMYYKKQAPRAAAAEGAAIHPHAHKPKSLHGSLGFGFTGGGANATASTGDLTPRSSTTYSTTAAVGKSAAAPRSYGAATFAQLQDTAVHPERAGINGSPPQRDGLRVPLLNSV